MKPSDIATELERTPGHISKELSTHDQLFEKMNSGLWRLRLDIDDSVVETEV